MKRNYKYEAEMLHWLDGGEIEQSCLGGPWWPFDNCWAFTDDWQYRIAEPDLSRNVLIGVTNNDAPLAEQQLWLYVNTAQSNADDTTYAESLIITDHRTYNTIGKIRMEDV